MRGGVLLALLLVGATRAAHLGLKNQGNTCYMNSLLQTLHHLPSFRRAVYSVPTGAQPGETAAGGAPPAEEARAMGTALALQRLFYELEHAEAAGASAVGTEPLTASFGWGPLEVNVQQDVQEFGRMLSEVLQTSMRARGVADGVAALFEGQTTSTARCTRVDFRSTKLERFHDLQLQVAGCRNLHASLRHFVREERLDGPNQYNTRRPELGRQDARRATRFSRLPPVLQLHLKRFEYDAETGEMRKLDSEFGFPTTLHLRRYMAPPADGAATEQPPPIYDLYAVLSHAGDAGAGHYVAYLRPDAAGKRWFEFDDASVREVPQDAAVRRQYGGRHGRGRGLLKMGPAPNAYMLVYVRRGAEAAAEAEASGPPSAALPADVRALFEETLQ